MIRIDGAHLTCADIAAAAYRRDGIVVTNDARHRVAASYQFADRISRERTVYGRSTGVGANRDVDITDPARHALSLVRSHATSAGPVRAAERVRATLVVRLNQLAAGGSGASLSLLDGLAAMLAADALPEVREHGSIGTGDLTALATIALALVGEVPTTGALPATIEFGVHDALPFMSSNAAAIGDAALACTELQMLARACVVVAGLTYTAIDGNPEAFAEVVERVTPSMAPGRSAAGCGRLRSRPLHRRGSRIRSASGHFRRHTAPPWTRWPSWMTWFAVSRTRRRRTRLSWQAATAMASSPTTAASTPCI